MFICILSLWGAVGIYLMIESDLNNCSHDSLWIMVLIEIIFMFGFVAIYIVIQINSCCSDSSSSSSNSKSCCGCRGFDNIFKSSTEQEISDDEETIRSLLSNNLDTFKINT